MNNKTVQLNAITKITTGLFIEEIVDMTLKGDSVHDMIKAGQENLNPKNNLNALHKGE